jgi:serine/threonine-protein kinase
MAEVYLARRRVAGVEKRLVIKRMRREHSRDPRFLDLFVREAQLSMSLVQQNIVPVFDFGRIGDDVFLAMEHIDGKDLGSTLALDRSAGMPPMLAAYIAAECCQALEHAHGRRDAATPKGVIHRDVTPRNVLVSWAGDVMLADFGIAAVVGQAGGDTMGTPGYMAPEQAQGGVIDARADVYSLGIVLWEAVTGTHVRPASNRAETVAVAKTGELPPIPDAVPPGLAAVIRGATAVLPDDRYDSARSMADALDTFIMSERARDGGTPPNRRLGEWLRERWASAADADPGEPAAGELGDMVTFLDDGADGVRSTQTERSIADTVATATPASAPVLAPEPAPVPVVRRASVRAIRGWVGVALVIAVVTGAYVVRSTGSDHRELAAVDPTAANPPVANLGAPAAANPPVASLGGPAAANPPVTDPPVANPAAANPAAANPAAASTAGKRAPNAGSGAKGKRPATGSDTPPTPEPVRRPTTLGAVPWANITVDDDPTVHETPVTLELAVGMHRVTFSNPQLGVTRTVTVTVPATGPSRHVESLR